MNEPMSIAVLAIYLIFFVFALLISMIPVVINGIGLARLCNKMSAFTPAWAWIWSLLGPSVALLRLGDIAGEWQDPLGCRRHFRMGVVLMIICVVPLVLIPFFAFPLAFLPENPRFEAAIAFLGIIIFVLYIIGMFAAVWLTVLMFISHFRIFKLYVPTWGAWLMLLGMFLLPQLSFLILPILSFLPMRDA